MNSLQFLEKRNEDNSLLRFKVPELNFLIAEKVFKFISNNTSYKILKKNLPSPYLDIFFKKKIYYDTTNIASKILINRWNYKNDKKAFVDQIPSINKPYHYIIEDLFKHEPFSFSKNKNFQIFSFLKSQKWFIYFYFLKLVNFFNKKQKKISSKKIKIGVNYVEGHNLEYRNDLFWVNDNFDNSSIIYYCENEKRLEKLSVGPKEIKRLNFSNINFIKLWKWKNLEKVDFIEKIKKEIFLLKPKDNLEKWLIKEIKLLLIQINYWYCFFQEHNIKIHLNSEEYSLSNVIRQIALNKLGGCSIGKCRSTPRKIEGDWFGYYPNDLFFVWGKDSAEGLLKSKNYFKNIIISGYPYQEKNNKLNEVFRIQNKFKKKGVKFSLLIIDGSHGKNEDDLHQLLPSASISKFLNSFLKWVLEDDEFGLIIKSKKPGLFVDLTEVRGNILKAKQTGRCEIIDKAGIEPKQFAGIVNFSIGISVDMPSSIVQIAIKGQKGIIYDYSDLSSIEKKLYNWGKNKTIFTDLEKLIEKLKSSKLGYLQDGLGDWSNEISYYDSFCDEKGGQRIGDFISDLKLYFEKGYKLNEAIKHVSSKYEKKWGRDKSIKV